MLADLPLNLPHTARLRIVGPAELANGAWPAHSPTPYTNCDVCNIHDTEWHSNLWAVGRWLVEQGFDGALYESTVRLLAPPEMLVHWSDVGGFIDLRFRRDAHRVAFDLTWRGYMQSALGERM